MGSGKSRHPLLARLFFQNATTKVTSPIGETTLSGNYPLCDKSWGFWISDQNPNDHKLSEHEKCNIETLNQTIRHQNVEIEKLEQLLKLHQGIDTDESTQEVMSTVLGTLQCIYITKDQSKSMLDDCGQMWQHTPTQFELG